MSTYAAFYNVHEGIKAQSIMDERRASANSTSSSGSQTVEPTGPSNKGKGFFRSIVTGLKPIEKAQKPKPIYQRERPLFKSF